jgi:hypothetical protein
VLLWNGRRVANEAASFAELGVPSGAHFVAQDPDLNASRGDVSASPRRSDAHTKARISELVNAVADLKDQVASARSTHEASEHDSRATISALEKRLRDEELRANDAEARVAELEAALTRSHELLQRAAGYSDPQAGLPHRAGPWRPQRQ